MQIAQKKRREARRKIEEMSEMTWRGGGVMERKITDCVERGTTFIKCPVKTEGKKKENKKYNQYPRAPNYFFNPLIITTISILDHISKYTHNIN